MPTGVILTVFQDAAAFLNLLDSANYFYKELMKQLQKQHGSVGAFADPKMKPTQPQSKSSRASKPGVDIHASCGRILTILGDLTRCADLRADHPGRDLIVRPLLFC